MKTVLYVLFIFFLASCAPTNRVERPFYFQTQQPTVHANESLLYIHRCDNIDFELRKSRSHEENIFVDGKLLAKLSDKEYTWIKVSPGLHRLSLSLYEKPKKIHPKAKETLYIKLKQFIRRDGTEYNIAPAVGGGIMVIPIDKYKKSSHFAVQERSEAIKAIAYIDSSCRYREALPKDSN